MNDTDLFPAPVIEGFPTDSSQSDQWKQERDAFWRLLPTLLSAHRGKFVAIYKGHVVDTGDDEIALIMRTYQRYGYVPIYVGLITDEPSRVVRLPSPRVQGGSPS